LWAETTDSATDPTQKARNGALSCLAEVCLEFAEGWLDRVEGLANFTKPIDTDDRAVLRRALTEHHVLVMRDQCFTPEQFKAAAQLFGEWG
jgi:Taurine catabolism dioxygenase TauD, TfdA family